MNLVTLYERVRDIFTDDTHPDHLATDEVIIRVHGPRKDKYFRIKYLSQGRLQMHDGKLYVEVTAEEHPTLEDGRYQKKARKPDTIQCTHTEVPYRCLQSEAIFNCAGADCQRKKDAELRFSNREVLPK